MKKQKTDVVLCAECGAKLTRDEIAVSQKLLGVKTDAFYCLECFARLYDVDVDYLRDKIEDWKCAGCALFG